MRNEPQAGQLATAPKGQEMLETSLLCAPGSVRRRPSQTRSRRHPLTPGSPHPARRRGPLTGGEEGVSPPRGRRTQGPGGRARGRALPSKKWAGTPQGGVGARSGGTGAGTLSVPPCHFSSAGLGGRTSSPRTPYPALSPHPSPLRCSLWLDRRVPRCPTVLTHFSERSARGPAGKT